MIYYTWYGSFMVVLLYGLIRYLFFFLKFSMIYHLMRKHQYLHTIFAFFLSNEFIKRTGKFELDYGDIAENYLACVLLIIIGLITQNAFKKKFKEREKIRRKSEIKKQEKIENLKEQDNNNNKKSEINVKDMFGGKTAKTQLEPEKLRKNIWLTIFLLYKGAMFPLIIFLFAQNMTFYKAIVIFIHLFMIKDIIKKFADSVKELKVLELVKVVISYFHKKFVKS